MPLSLNVSNMQSFYQQHQEIDAAGSPQIANALAEYINSWSQETDPTENGPQEQETIRMPPGSSAASAASSGPQQYGSMQAYQGVGPESSHNPSFPTYPNAVHTFGQVGATMPNGGQFTFRLPSQPTNNRIVVGLLPPATISKGPVASKRTKHRAVRACNRCRQGKQKCNGEHPCMKCVSRGHVCVYDERPLKKSGLPIACKNRGQEGSSLIATDSGKRKLETVSSDNSKATKIAKQEPGTSIRQDKLLPHQQWSADHSWSSSSQGRYDFISDYAPSQAMKPDHTDHTGLPPVAVSMTRSSTQIPGGFASSASSTSLASAGQNPYSLRMAENRPSAPRLVIAHGTGTNTSLVNPGFHSSSFGGSHMAPFPEQQPARGSLSHDWFSQGPRADQHSSTFGFVAVAPHSHHFDSISPLSTPVVGTPNSEYHSAMSNSQSYPVLHAHAPVSSQSHQLHSQVAAHQQHPQQHQHYHAQLYASAATAHEGMYATAPPTRCISAPVPMQNSSLFHMPHESSASVTSNALPSNIGGNGSNQSTAQDSAQQRPYWPRGPSSTVYDMCQPVGVSNSCDSTTAMAVHTPDTPNPFPTGVSRAAHGMHASSEHQMSGQGGGSSLQGIALDRRETTEESPDPQTKTFRAGDQDQERGEDRDDERDCRAAARSEQTQEGGEAETLKQEDSNNSQDRECDALSDADAAGSPVDMNDAN